MRNNKNNMKIKREVLNEYILPVMTYGSETWALNNTTIVKLSVAQYKMERIMLGITLRDRKRNTWIRQQTGVTDITDYARKAKHGPGTLQGYLITDGHQSYEVDPKKMVQKTWTPQDTLERRPHQAGWHYMVENGQKQVSVEAFQ